MQTDAQEALKTLSLKKIWLPILCGLAITGFLIYRSDKISNEIVALLSKPNWGYLCLALVAIVLREVGHICRLRILSNQTLNWTSCFYVSILWEFASAVTPSVVGGGIVAIFLLSKEGFSMGRSLSYIIVNGIMDNLFFLLAGLSGVWGGYEGLFAMAGELSSTVKTIFFINYTILFIYTSIIAAGVFINPKLLKWILMQVTRIGFLRRWRRSAYKLSVDIIVTSNEFRGRGPLFWCKMFLCTVLTWTVRYSFLNCLIAAYSSFAFREFWTVFSKQVVMWALMLVPLAPGGSGFAEILFQQFFEPMLGNYTLLMALLWRVCTFYIYLALGVIFLPKWIRRVFKRNTS